MSLRVSNFDKDHLFVLSNNKNRFFNTATADGDVKKSPVISSPLYSPTSSSELQTHLEESNQFYMKLEKQLEKKHAKILHRSSTSTPDEETTTVPKQVLKSIQVQTRNFLSLTRTTFDKSVDTITENLSTGWLWNYSLRIVTLLAMLLIFVPVQTWRFIVWPIVWPSNDNPFINFKSEGAFAAVIPGKILVQDAPPNLTTLLRQQQECVAATSSSSDYNIQQCLTSDDEDDDSNRRLQ